MGCSKRKYLFCLVSVMIAMFCNTITVLALQDLEQFENGIEEFENDLTEMYKSISRPRRSLMDAMRMPGTNWCGKGWRATRFEELGAYGGADKCCRQHDLGCPMVIQGLSKNFGLYNWRLHATMHCTCDDRFRSCLKMTGTSSANVVGRMFFNMIQIPCFYFTEVNTCVRWNWWGMCDLYEPQKRAKWRHAKAY